MNVRTIKFFSSSVLSFFRFCIDLIFPIECLGCGKEGLFLCEECLLKIPYRFSSSCVFCRHPSSEGKPCLECAKTHALDGVFAAGEYSSKLLRRAIHAFKYDFVEELAEPLGKFLAEYLEEYRSLFECVGETVVVPIPLARKKVLERGFNQAESLAKILAAHFRLPLESGLLKRRRATDSQVGLSEAERKENIAGAFETLDSASLRGKTILLVDDVVTTGVTLEECARVFKTAGAKEVWGAVLAKG